MGRRLAIGGMWGTTHLNLFLLDLDAGTAIETRHGSGVSLREGRDFDDILLDLAGDWLLANAGKPIVLAGMVGSTLGWVEAPYLPCPAAAEDIVAAVVEMNAGEHRVCILPGLRCVNAFGETDVLRGEETELIGALAAGDGLKRRLIAIPGTHTKWVEIEQGRVARFTTHVAGELYHLLLKNGVLAQQAGELSSTTVTDAFLDGVRDVRSRPKSLVASLFSGRARQVTGQGDADATRERMSGLLIGADVGAALDHLEIGKTERVELIGTEVLTKRYAAALQSANLEVSTFDSKLLGAKGLAQVSRVLSERIS